MALDSRGSCMIDNDPTITKSPESESLDFLKNSEFFHLRPAGFNHGIVKSAARLKIPTVIFEPFEIGEDESLSGFVAARQIIRFANHLPERISEMSRERAIRPRCFRRRARLFAREWHTPDKTFVEIGDLSHDRPRASARIVGSQSFWK